MALLPTNMECYILMDATWVMGSKKERTRRRMDYGET